MKNSGDAKLSMKLLKQILLYWFLVYKCTMMEKGNKVERIKCKNIPYYL